MSDYLLQQESVFAAIPNVKHTLSAVSEQIFTRIQRLDDSRNQLPAVQRIQSHPLIQSLFSEMPAMLENDSWTLFSMWAKKISTSGLLHDAEFGQHARAWIARLLGEQGGQKHGCHYIAPASNFHAAYC